MVAPRQRKYIFDSVSTPSPTRKQPRCLLVPHHVHPDPASRSRSCCRPSDEAGESERSFSSMALHIRTGTLTSRGRSNRTRSPWPRSRPSPGTEHGLIAERIRRRVLGKKLSGSPARRTPWLVIRPQFPYREMANPLTHLAGVRRTVCLCKRSGRCRIEKRRPERAAGATGLEPTTPGVDCGRVLPRCAKDVDDG